MFLLDTNICSTYFKRPGRLAHRFMQHNGGLVIPTVVLAGLLTWAERRRTQAELWKTIEEDLLCLVAIIDFDQACARECGKLRAALLSVGVVIEPVDAMIAAVAIVHDLTLVTHNLKHFQSVPGLRIEDWLE